LYKEEVTAMTKPEAEAAGITGSVTITVQPPEDLAAILHALGSVGLSNSISGAAGTVSTQATAAKTGRQH
jgi:hypothetical protein